MLLGTIIRDARPVNLNPTGESTTKQLKTQGAEPSAGV